VLAISIGCRRDFRLTRRNIAVLARTLPAHDFVLSEPAFNASAMATHDG
jgi:hypothetical protein